MTTGMIANRYKVIRTLGEGAMGLVLQVEDSSLGQEMALKVISPKAVAKAQASFEKTVLQFKQEFRLMTQLRHPNCCAVYDYGVTAEGAPYFTMEIVPGQGLDEIGVCDAQMFKSVFAQLLLALGYLHHLGFVHRDIKSANVRVRRGPDGQWMLKLMDYGLMDFAGRSGAPISGTPAYMAPEVIKRGPIDQRTDLYAAGVLAYEMLTGRLPFGSGHGTDSAVPGSTSVGALVGSMSPSGLGSHGTDPGQTARGVMALLRSHVNDRPVSVRQHNPTIPLEIANVVMRLMAKEPLERFRSAHEVLRALGVENTLGAADHLLTSPLMGREVEMERLQAQLAQLVQQQICVPMVLEGASGLGKSRLLEEFRFAVQLADIPFACGRLLEHGHAPYAPFVSVFKMLLPAMWAHIPEDLARHAAVLVKLLPELGAATGLGAIEPAPEIDPPSKEKMRLQSVLAEVLAALALKTPVVIALEDWHWVDPLSREFFTYLMRNTREVPLFAILTSRPVGENVAELPAEATVLPVGPLAPAGVRNMVTSMLGMDQVDDLFLTRVIDFSQGNPLLVRELLEHLVQGGTLLQEQGRWNTTVALTPNRLPKNLKGLLLRKVTYLSSVAQEVARAGAVAGKAFDIDLLAQVTGLSEERLFGALEMLHLQNVFSVGEDEKFTFAQEQLQELLYATMELSTKQVLHTSVARFLEARLLTRLDGAPLAEAELAQITAIAHHYMAGNMPDKTIEFALEAGMQSARLFANTDAERFLTAGLALIRAEAAGPERWMRQRFDYLRTLGDVRRMAGEVALAIQAYEEVLPLAGPLGEERRQGDLMTSLAKSYQIHGDLPAAFSWCERSLAACETQGDRVGAARSLLTSCRVHYYRGQQAEAIRDTERALDLAREAGERFRIGEAYAFLGYLYTTSAPEKVQQGIGYLHESVRLLQDLGDKIGLQNSYNLLGNAQTMQGAFQEARVTFELNHKICFEVGMRDDEIVTYLNLAICELELGNFTEAVRRAQQALALAERNHNPFHEGLALTFEASAKSYLGQFTGAIGLMDRALKLALDAQNTYVETMVMQYKVEAYLVQGHLGEAKAAAKKLIDLIKETGNAEPEGRMYTLLGEIVARQGDFVGGREYVAHALEAATTAGARGISARALKVKSWIALQLGEWEEAKRVATQAHSLSRSLGAKYLTAELEGILGEIALATKQGSALEHFENMEEVAIAMSSDLLVAMALFGQAAAHGSPTVAVPLVSRAQKLLQGLLEGLAPDSRLCFANLRERQRILDGDFIGGFRPRGTDLGTRVSLPGIKLGQGFWGLT